jgi:ribonucleoside-triphosphate reductase
LNKQYLTIGINGLNQAAEFMGIRCNDNEEYKNFCQTVFSTIKEQNTLHNTTKGHKLTFNTECVPAESLAAKNYKWDKEDGYWVPSDTNLYASYIFKPNDPSISVLEKIRLHGKDYIGDYLDGGSACHINLDHHLDVEQYTKLLHYAAEQGCQYFTFNVPNSECQDCGWIGKKPVKVCPRCGSTHIDYYDRIIGYLTKIRNWADCRKIEQKTRVYEKFEDRA